METPLHPDVLIRPAILADAAEIARIHVATWQAAYRGVVPQGYLDALSVCDRTQFWTEHLGMPDHGVLVAEQRLSKRDLRGWASYGKSRDSRAAEMTAELYAIYINPLFWKTGIGRALFQVAESNLKAMGFRQMDVRVLKENPQAHRFYEQMGLMWAGHQQMIKIGNVHLVELRFTKQL